VVVGGGGELFGRATAATLVMAMAAMMMVLENCILKWVIEDCGLKVSELSFGSAEKCCALESATVDAVDGEKIRRAKLALL